MCGIVVTEPAQAMDAASSTLDSILQLQREMLPQGENTKQEQGQLLSISCSPLCVRGLLRYRVWNVSLSSDSEQYSFSKSGAAYKAAILP